MVARDAHSGSRPLPARTTVYEVARQAGVSVATVSRAFSRPDRVNTHTRDHVLAVAAEIGYQPNPEARVSSSARTGTIALLVTDIANPHFFGIMRGASRQAAATRRSILLGETDEHPETERILVERLSSTVDGFVLAASRMTNDDLRRLAKTKPVALVNRELSGVSSVTVEHEAGTQQIVEHLASLGHRSIAFLAGPKTSWTGAKRWQSLDAAAHHLGLTATRLGPFNPTIAGGAAAADAALVSKATAVVAFNDLLALGVLHRLADRGIPVPGQISVVGYDNIFGSDFSSPTLTTLGGPADQMGRAAVELVVRMIREPGHSTTSTRQILPSQLTIRTSTGPATGRTT
ncbi:LacI family DNA-binding transcriptional regulator [Mycolicibacterium sp.]|uniref:LacI family DNA-binding transcriptional regulator n=1 Tax=Mycolicibacterium sp. TaxID=2320850 RepID=UPI0037C7F11A